MSSSMKNTLSKNKKTNNTLNVGKREKLKSLLVEKFVKKFNVPAMTRTIEKEVALFIQKDKLTDVDLKQFEEKLKKIIETAQNSSVNSEPNNLAKKDNSDVQSHYRTDQNDQREISDKMDQMSMHSNITDISKKFSKNPLKYEEINNFELKKLLENQRTPLKRQDFQGQSDEWNAIDKYKNNLYQNFLKENKEREKAQKNQVRETYNSQIREKEQLKNDINIYEDKYHRALLANVNKLTEKERDQLTEMEKKRLKEKEIRDLQIQENIERKKAEFGNNRQFDTHLGK